MRFSPSKQGGRIASGSTPWGDFRVEWDAAGRLVAEGLMLREPGANPGAEASKETAKEDATSAGEPVEEHGPGLLRLLTPAQRDLVRARRERCEGCTENEGLSTVTVRCRGCGCAGLSLVHGTCKLGRWAQGNDTRDRATRKE